MRPLVLASIFTGLVAATAAFSGAVQAQDMVSPERLSVGVGGGTNGLSVEAAYQVAPQVVVRAQGSFVDLSHNFRSNDVSYDGKLHFNTGGGFVDWHFNSAAWMLSLGAVEGQRKVDVTARPVSATSITIHGVTYPVTEVSQVDGVLGFGNPAPVASIGWDNTYSGEHHLGFRALVGVAFGDQPQARLRAIGPYANNATVLTDLAAEQVSLQHDARDFRFYPLAQLGLSYRF